MTNFTTSDFLLPGSKSFTSLPQWLLIPFVIISIIESILGIVGNGLVIIVISCIGKSNILSTPHNCFIVNLALSDLVLCLFTMPLNTYRSLYIYMRFPPAFCKLADSFPAINICVSSLTIVTISIYRYLVVCYPHKKLNGTFLTFTIMISIWLLAILAASPLFIYSLSTQVYDDVLIESMLEMICMHSLNDSCIENNYRVYRSLHVCHESWPKHSNWHLLYTIFIFFLQFILPISIICLTYYQVMIKLQERMFKNLLFCLIKILLTTRKIKIL
jgi:neuropeptide Y receptor